MDLGTVDWKTLEDVAKLVGMIGGWIFGSWQWWKGRKATAQLRAIARRGDAPFLCPSEKAFDFLYEGAQEGSVSGWNSSNGNVLCFSREEVSRDAPADTPVIFVLDNNGEDARKVIAKLEGKQVPLRQEPNLRDACGLIFLKYPYDPVKHGKQQRLTIWFETRSGVQDTHTYFLVHGFRQLERIEPA